MQFSDMSGTYTSELTLAPIEGSTEIKWTYDGDVIGTAQASPMYKVMGLFMDKFLGSMYEQGLVKLKKVAESAPTPMDSTSTK